MRIGRCCAVVLAGSVVTIIACGGSVDSSCGNYFDAINSLAAKCGSAPLFDPSLRSSFVQDCDALAKAPGTNDLSSQLDSCSDQIKSGACVSTSLSCIIKGTLADGAACGASVQCSGGRCPTTPTNNPTSELPCGTCASYAAIGGACPTGNECNPKEADCVQKVCTAYLAQGAACTTTGAQCTPGLICDTTQMTCQPLPDKGATCTFACAVPYKCVSGTCADAVAEGGACPIGIECASTLTCDQTTHTCKAQTHAQVGQACGLVNQQEVTCDSTLKCVANVCVAPKPEGATCTVGNFECAPAFVCANGTCQIPDYASCK